MNLEDVGSEPSAEDDEAAGLVTPVVELNAVPVPVRIADGVRRQVDPAFVNVERLGWWVITAVVGVVVLLGNVSSWLFGWSNVVVRSGGSAFSVALFAFLVWMAIHRPRWDYERLAYAVTDEGVDIWRGVWWRSLTSVPRSRVQHTDVSQGPLQRSHGLATLVIHTAGTSEATVELPGLRHETAIRIRDFLIRGDAT